MLFTNRDVIRAFQRREKAKAGLQIVDEGVSDEEDVDEANKDEVRHCIKKLNKEKPQQPGDAKEMVDVWLNFIKNNKRFQIVQNRVNGKILALKIIKNVEDVNNERGYVSTEEPYILGTLTSWGNLDVCIIESKYTHKFNCLETTREMIEAY